MESTPIQYIDTQEELKATVEMWGKNDVKELAVDFEGESNRHRYGFHLCLIQIFDKSTFYLIDPVVIGDITPLKLIFEDKNIIKVLYSSDFDIRLLYFVKGYRIRGLYDVQIAAKVLNYDEINLSYLVGRLTPHEFIKNRKFQKSNWNIRPISEDLLNYAVNDVRFLFTIKDGVEKELTAAGLNERFSSLNLEAEELEFRIRRRPYLAVKYSKSLSYDQKIYLKHFFNTREKLAEKLDYPPFKVIHNDFLLGAAKNPPKSTDEWVNMKGYRSSLEKYAILFSNAKLKAEQEIKQRKVKRSS